MISVERAVEVFGRGFCVTRSFTHPYELVRVGPLWVMRDGPRRSGTYRCQEVISHGVSPEETLRTLAAYRPERFALCVIHSMSENREAIRDAFKSGGLALRSSEALMAREVADERPIGGPHPVRRVLSNEDAIRVAKAAGSRQILPQHLEENSLLRLYAAFDGDTPVGWVRSIQVLPDAAWVSNMYVRSDYRRRGLARSIMSVMLADDHRFGVEHSVLLASNAGAQLYPVLGYEHIGVLQLFMPRKSGRAAAPDQRRIMSYAH